MGFLADFSSLLHNVLPCAWSNTDNVVFALFLTESFVLHTVLPAVAGIVSFIWWCLCCIGVSVLLWWCLLEGSGELQVAVVLHCCVSCVAVVLHLAIILCFTCCTSVAPVLHCHVSVLQSHVSRVALMFLLPSSRRRMKSCRLQWPTCNSS